MKAAGFAVYPIPLTSRSLPTEFPPFKREVNGK